MSEKFKILIVDDSIQWLKSHLSMLKNLFEKDLFEIDTATSARKGLDKVLFSRDNPYDLIITDLEMERIFGEEYAGSWLIQNLINREECKNTKFLIISGSYNIWDIANKFKVSHIAKDQLIGNPMLLKYRIMDLLKIEN